MSDQPRSAQRQRVLKGAHIVIKDGFSTIDCTVRNLSETGALLKVASVVGIPEQFRLQFDDGREFSCTIAWKREREIGVQFT